MAPFNQVPVALAALSSGTRLAYLRTERTSVLIVRSALQHFLDCPDFVHATLSAYDDRSLPQDTLAKIPSP